MKAVIPAAGLGTRMLPATKAVPKELLPVAGKPLIQYAVEEAVASGIDSIIIVVRDGNSLIQQHFCPDKTWEASLRTHGLIGSLHSLKTILERVNLCYVQQERPRGLADALSCARPLLENETFVVLLPDVIMISDDAVTKQLMRVHSELGGSVIAVREVTPEHVNRFGILKLQNPTELVDKPLPVVGLVEKPAQAQAPSHIGVFGRYLLQASIWDAIAQTRPDDRGEVQLTDALNILCQHANVFGSCFAGRHFDAGDRKGYLQANIELALRDPEQRESLVDYLTSIIH